MATRVAVSPAVLDWALEVSSTDIESVHNRFRVSDWSRSEGHPTVNQLEDFAAATGVPFGLLLLTDPPQWTLPIHDFRDGFGRRSLPSANLMAVLDAAQMRQDWYREYAIEAGAGPLAFVGAAADSGVEEAASLIRSALNFEVVDRRGNWTQTRRQLLRSFEALGGLTIATSMVANNTHRMLDPEEFRGFALVDEIAPLIFVNTGQTMNGQIFTIAHEIAHVWLGASGIGSEDIRGTAATATERWCNAVASEVLVPQDDLRQRFQPVAELDNVALLEELAAQFRCGTLVVLQAIHRTGLREYQDFDAVYDTEVSRLQQLVRDSDGQSGGDFYNNQPFRIGERLSYAIAAEMLAGRTSPRDAMGLMGLKSLSALNKYIARVGGGYVSP